MAHMIPPDPPPDGPGTRAERLVYEALRDQLDDGWFVYSQLHFVGDGDAREGEADLVCLHRDEGLLVVEVKGEGVRRSGTGTWTRVYADGRVEPLARSPFVQAQDQVKALRRKLEARLARLLPRLSAFPLVTGHAVAFPLASRAEAAGELPLDVPEPLLYDAHDLPRLGERVRATLAWWARRGAPRERLADHELKMFRKRLLAPCLELAPGLGATLAADEHRLLQLTREQAQVLEMFLGNPRVQVRGGAGTGKTVLALEAARRLAEDGARVLLACFNRGLGEHLRASVEAWEDPALRERVHATTFHRLCAWASHAVHDRPLAVPEGAEARRRFFDEEAPLVVLEALEAGRLPRFDALVVDEAQDLAPDWWHTLLDLLADRAAGRVLVFHDPTQDLFDRAGADVAAWPSIELRVNFRTTRALNDVVNRLGGAPLRAHPRAPEGEPPAVERQPERRKLATRLDRLVGELLREPGVRPEDIALLTPHRRASSSLEGLDTVAGHPLADLDDARPGALTHATLGAFKGLEAPFVILLDVDPADPRCDRKARYVGASRARHRLVVLERAPWLADVDPAPP